MIADALRAELFRARRNRVALFWAYGFVPLFTLIVGLVLDMAMRVDAGATLGVADPVRAALRGAAAAGNPIAGLFYAIGAASLFAGDYRWESWRLATPRNSRANLILAKFGSFALLSGASLLLSILAEVASGFYQPLRFGAPIAWPEGIAPLGTVLLALAGSLLEMLVLGSIAALGAVATRSLIGGALPAFLLGLMQSFGLGFLNPPTALDRWLLMPAQAGDALRGWAAGGVPADIAIAAAAVLAGWTLLLGAATLLLFRSQDLARE